MLPQASLPKPVLLEHPFGKDAQWVALGSSSLPEASPVFIHNETAQRQGYYHSDLNIPVTKTNS
jgi:hypothetical protein